MKILIVTHYFWPEFFLVNGLVTELKKKGHHVEVLTGLPNYPQGEFFNGYSFWKGPWKESYQGIDVYRVPLLARKKGFIHLFLNYVSYVFFASFFGIFKIKTKPDLIFCYAPSPATSCLPAIVLKWFFKCPLSFWVQDLWPESLAAVGVTKSPIILNAVGTLVRFIYSQCDQILIQSEAFRESVLYWGAREERVYYLPNWAPSNFNVSVKQPEWLSRLPRGFKIVFAGNIGKAQDMPTLIEAAAYLRNKYSEINDIHWVIVGDGSELKYVKEEAKKKSLEKFVHTFGQRPNQDMPSLFEEADILLVILKNEAIFSLTIPAKVQSYMASGKPILAALNGEGSRIIKLAGAGLSCAPEDPIELAEKVMQFYKMDIDQKKIMGKSGKDYSDKNFAQDLVVKRLIEIFKDKSISL